MAFKLISNEQDEHNEHNEHNADKIAGEFYPCKIVKARLVTCGIQDAYTNDEDGEKHINKIGFARLEMKWESGLYACEFYFNGEPNERHIFHQVDIEIIETIYEGVYKERENRET